MTNKPSSLYIHIPFCEHICSYCDFPKLQYFYNVAKEYLKNLKKEIESYNISTNLKTIYIGGGTPTSLDDDLFLELLKIVDKYAKNVEEYTVEANPESLSLTKLTMMKNHHVTRISIGVESTDDKILKTINRNHTFNDVINAIQNARKIGFNNINVDLIIGLPQVSDKMLLNDINNLINLNVEHISCYSLSVHPNTVFGINHVKEISDDHQRKLYDLVNRELTNNGFNHYEISNWAKDGYESKHNKVYWRNKSYYGVGLGAAGYLSDTRYVNTKSITEYNNGQFLLEKEQLTIKDKIEYQIMLNLRTNEGLSLEELRSTYAYDLYKEKEKDIKEMIQNNLLTLKNDKLIPTYEGMMVLDTIILKLI